MFRFLLSVVAMLALATFASPSKGDDVVPAAPDVIIPAEEIAQEGKADAAYGVKYTQERIVQLPQDKDKFYLSIYGDANDPKFQAVVKWFSTNNELAAFKAQVHFNAVETTSAIYKERYAKTVAKTPCVRVQDAQGVRLYQCSGDGIPLSAEALTKALNTECLRRWRKNHGQPEPTPDPTPDTTPDNDYGGGTPNTNPDTPPVDDFPYLLMWVVVGVALIGGGAYGVVGKLRELRAKPGK
jgi:hypothetical protein